MIINGAHDDLSAIWHTGIQEYQLFPRLIGVGLVCFVLLWLLTKYMSLPVLTWSPQSRKQRVLAVSAFALSFCIIAVFFRFGGAFNYNRSIHWENAARLSSPLLNEAVLDDAQALYRVHSIYKRQQGATTINFDSAELRKKIERAHGNPKASTIEDAFTHTITTERLRTKPKTVVLIINESYGLFPFLPEYDEIGSYLVEEGRKIINSSQSMHAKYGLAMGSGTIAAVNGFVTGMPEVGLYTNYEKESYKNHYGFGISEVMKKFGYKTVFWYAGFGTWQNVEPFVKAQGFDEYYDVGSFEGAEVNTWGTTDGALFDNALAYIKKHKDEKILHVFLTISNHPPYNIDLDKAGFDKNRIANHHIDTIGTGEDSILQMGHFWYADHVMGKFIQDVEVVQKESLFVITGDHSERFNFTRNISPREYSTTPIIFYGHGIQSGWMPTEQVGLAMQIIPTLAELVGHPGETYQSILPSLFDSMGFAFNHRLWADKHTVHGDKKDMPEHYRQYQEDVMNIALWRVRKGNIIEP